MNHRFNFYCLLLVFSTIAVAETERLSDFEVFKVNSPEEIEPSGLHIKDGVLYTVCDDANNIYRLSFKQDSLVDAVVDQKLDVTQLAAMNLDLEGITAVGDDFFVVSETHHKLVRVVGDEIKWVPELGGVYAKAHEAGLFQVYNAGLEAATYLGNQTFLLAVEREPRGLIEVTFDQQYTHIIKQTNQRFAEDINDPSAARQPDLTGLFSFGGKIFGLHRNAYLIQEISKGADGLYQTGKAWSYEHIVRDAKYAYQDMQFGHAEGLAMDDDYFYLIIDNNKNPNAKNPNDKRPLLIRAKRD
ncbi:SdiA-regulated domain-containing protein [Marinicella sp. S1101]|uniref:SdiA-regulated domain-containing protein n=1 Tax=Marinicella marina TaxID=2996016 RepID=UPI002260C83D|nr:SdiA-regulated domain-containing protein [Marinicella marina]MCX7554620.1 SdiA-regulated domain-containing protein [Marinicella marina]MDJ1140685.1 SdiA-regulated domain-containing protein [Marinicella marina]